jgi:hypothetical protein
MKKLVYVKIDDYKQVKKSLREFMKYTKKCNTACEKYARYRYLKQIKLELDSFLKSKGMLRKAI